MTAASAGCLQCSAFRVDTGGPELTLKRAESGRSGAEGSEPDRVTWPAGERTVQSLEGARVHLRTEYAGVADGDVTGTAGPIIAVRSRSSDSAIDDTGESVHEVNLATIETLEVAGPKSEAGATALVLLAAIGGALADGAAAMPGLGGN